MACAIAVRVTVMTGGRVETIDHSGVIVNGERINSQNVIWAAGVQASPAAQWLGAEADRAGRVPVQADLSLQGHPEISVIGDLAAAQSGGKPVPGVSPAAKQMGRCAAANVLARLRGQATQDFRYVDYGSLATLGRMAAVVQLEVPLLGRLRLSGYPAWLFWLFAHVYFLIGFRNRLVVLIDWASAYWSRQRYARVVADIEPPPRPAPPLTSQILTYPSPTPSGARRSLGLDDDLDHLEAVPWGDVAQEPSARRAHAGSFMSCDHRPW